MFSQNFLNIGKILRAKIIIDFNSLNGKNDDATLEHSVQTEDDNSKVVKQLK